MTTTQESVIVIDNLHKAHGKVRYLERMPVTPSLRSRAGSEPMRFAQGKLREGSGSTGAEILRFAQDDSPDPAQVRSREALSPNV